MRDLGKILCGVVIFILGSTHCSWFRKQLPPQKIIVQTKEKKCLSTLPKLFSKWKKNQLSKAQWDLGKTCILASLSQWEKKVRGQAKGVWSLEEVTQVLNHMYFKKEPLLKKEIQALLHLKQMFFGGGGNVLSKKDLDRFRDFLEHASILFSFGSVLSKVHEKKTRTLRGWIFFQRAFQSFGEKVAFLFQKKKKTNTLSERDFFILWNRFFKNIYQTPPLGRSNTFGVFKNSHTRFRLYPLIWDLKVLFLGGTRKGWTREELLRGVRAVFLAWGTQIAWKGFLKDEMQKKTRENTGWLLWGKVFKKLLENIESFLKEIATWKKGKLSYQNLDALWVHLSILDNPVQRRAWNQYVRIFGKRFLRSSFSDGISFKGVFYFLRFFYFWEQGESFLGRVFKNEKLSWKKVSASKIQKGFKTFFKNHPAQVPHVHLTRFLWFLKFFPLYQNRFWRISLPTPSFQSFSNLERFHLFDVMVALLLQTYSSTAEKTRASRLDLDRFLKEIMVLLGKALHVADPTIPFLTQKHFNNVTLFTLASNGDAWIDQKELLYYLGQVISSKIISIKIEKDLKKLCYEPSLGEDPIGWPWIRARCFRNVFYKKMEKWFFNFPKWVQFFKKISQKQKKLFIALVEQGSRLYGCSEAPLGSYDLDSIAVFPHLLEILFQRFDRHPHDEILQTSEVKKAFPFFKRRLSELVKLPSWLKSKYTEDFLLYAGLTYVLRYGKLPDTGSFSGGWKFFRWILKKPFWKLKVNRLQLMRVFGMLSIPPSVSKKKFQKSIFCSVLK